MSMLAACFNSERCGVLCTTRAKKTNDSQMYLEPNHAEPIRNSACNQKSISNDSVKSGDDSVVKNDSQKGCLLVRI